MTPDLFHNQCQQVYWKAFHEARQILPEAYAAVAGETARQAREKRGHTEEIAICAGVIHALNAYQGGAYPFPVVLHGDGPGGAA